MPKVTKLGSSEYSTSKIKHYVKIIPRHCLKIIVYNVVWEIHKTVEELVEL